MKRLYLLCGIFSVFGMACGQTSAVPDRLVGGPCEGCDLWSEGISADIGWDGRIGPIGAPGEPMVIEGVIYKKDGKTPASGIILYLYQTNAAGLYAPGPGQDGAVRRHGAMRGWVKTGADGHYRFATIRPGQYPGRRIPAHIHPTIKEPELQAYYIDDYVFTDDSFLDQSYRDKEIRRAGSGIINVRKDAGGTWRGRRDIVLGLNIPGY